MPWQPSDPGGSATDIPVEVGDVLADKYRVERILGAGGMGVVVAARHIDLGELRAVKFLRRELIDSSEVVERFLREARAVVKLRSRHVVQVHDVGRFDTGEPFIVMEYLEGEDLDSVIERGEPTPLREGIDIVMQALAAMADAHAAGIIHRDLKPGNLFLAKDASGEICVKVLDFGISKIRDPDGDQNMRMTATDAIMGTPYYMSPEQMMSTRDVDERTDIWSIGVVLYELLSKRLPFKGNNIAAQCRLLLQMDPEPLTPTSGEPLPEGFQQAVVKFLLRDPRDRYVDVLDAAEALAQFGGPASHRALEDARRALAGRRSSRAAGTSDARTSGAGASAAIAPKAASMGHISRPVLDKDSGGVSHPGTLEPGGTRRAAMGHAATLPSVDGVGADEQMSRSTRASWQTQSPVATTSRSRRGVVVALGAALVVAGVGAVVALTAGGASTPAGAASSDLAATAVTKAPPSTEAEPAAAPSAPETTASVAAAPSAEASALASAEPSASAIPTARVGVAPPPPPTRDAPPPPPPPPATAKSPPSKGDPFGSGRH